MSSRVLAASSPDRSTGEAMSRRGPTHQLVNNRFISTLASPLRLQTKLTVNTPGDQYEQEADRVADQIMRMPEPSLQRQCSCGKSSGGEQCDECKKKKKQATGNLQRAATSSTGGIAAPSVVERVLSSPGSPLPDTSRAYMESRFGQDFSHVRVHTNHLATESAATVSGAGLHCWKQHRLRTRRKPIP